MTDWYTPDLAYIHDVGFRDYALKSAPGILAILKHHHLFTGLIVDLGCGSGLSAQVLHQAGYQVLGIDISEAMIAIAKTRAPMVEFRIESFFTADIASPLRTCTQPNGRISYWAVIPEYGDRVLRVITLEDGKTLHNAYFDRNFRSRLQRGLEP